MADPALADHAQPWRSQTPEAQTQLVPEMPDLNPLAVARPLPPDLLLIVFIHGFKGTDETFAGFPDRLQHVLTETIPNVVVECIVFPAYETKGNLGEAVERFADWLVTLTVNREVANGTGGGAGKAKVVLCGHSMGGLLAADTLLNMFDSRVDAKAPLWPKIIALIAFDTPYFGLHPYVFRNSASKATEYVRTAASLWETLSSPTGGASASSAAARSAPIAALPAPPASASASSSVWKKYAGPAAWAAGGVLAAGALGAAYMRRNDLIDSYTWVGDHMKYVGTLWDSDALARRVERIGAVHTELGVVFRTFYTQLPAQPPAFPHARTFIILPSGATAAAAEYFVPATNGRAANEIDAHTGMFGAATNDGYYALGLATAALVREAVMLGRGVVEDGGHGGDGAGQERRERVSEAEPNMEEERKETKAAPMDAMEGRTEAWGGNPWTS